MHLGGNIEGGLIAFGKLRRILKEYIEEGRPVREWIAAEMPNLGARSKEP